MKNEDIHNHFSLLIDSAIFDWFFTNRGSEFGVDCRLHSKYFTLLQSYNSAGRRVQRPLRSKFPSPPYQHKRAPVRRIRVFLLPDEIQFRLA